MGSVLNGLQPQGSFHRGAIERCLAHAPDSLRSGIISLVLHDELHDSGHVRDVCDTMLMRLEDHVLGAFDEPVSQALKVCRSPSLCPAV